MDNLVQINADGSTEVGDDPEGLSFDEHVEIIRSSLEGSGWSIDSYDQDSSRKRHHVTISKSGETISSILYVFSPVKIGRQDPLEKSIQLGKYQYLDDFARAADESPTCALLGIYQHDDLTLFCAWDPATRKKVVKNPRVWISTDLMAAGARTGFAADRTDQGYVRCAFTSEMLASFLHNIPFIFKWRTEAEAFPEAMIEGDEDETQTVQDKVDVAINPVPDDIPHNRIFYGAPGTGKSHNLDLELNAHFKDEVLYERTTFYPDYTSGTFMGAYRPTPIYRAVEGDYFEADQTSVAANMEPIIDYRFVPGPFLRVLAKALANPKHNFCLVVEEINRANASAVLADAFQMLDRDDKGEGKYSVTLPPEAQDYLLRKGHTGTVRLPANMYIWATMNSADQGVMTLDSAFKRRWTMQYVGLDEGEHVVDDWELHLAFRDQPIKWNDFRHAINSHLSREGVAEDRLLGPFFMSKKDLSRPKAFEDQILQYLRDDVVKNSPGKLFTGGTVTFGSLVARYRAKDNIFVPEVGLGDS